MFLLHKYQAITSFQVLSEIPPIAVWMRIALTDRLVYLNAWYLVNWTVWESLESVALLEEIMSWGGALKFPKHIPGPASQSLSACRPADQDASFRLQACLPATMLPAMMNIS